MTTKLITSTKSLADTLYGFNQLPALFNDNWFHSIFGQVDKAFDAPGVHYPYNVLVHRSKDTNSPFEYEIQVALAGLNREDIKIQVKENKLIIGINPKEDDIIVDHFISYVRNGISYRRASLEFSLAKEVEPQNIHSKFKNGLLKVYVPLTKQTSTDINISVD